MVDVKTLESFKWAEPFRPFEIELDDGTIIRVRQPLTVGWSEEVGKLIYPVGEDGTSWTQLDRVVAVRHLRRHRRRRKAS